MQKLNLANNDIKVSAVIITHNRCELLKRAVESVEMQSYKNMELIIVDDASNDGTTEYGKELIKEGHTYVHIDKEQSKGGNYARNVGIEIAKGDFVAFLDDDDYWHYDKIEQQVVYARNHPEAGLIYSGFEVNYGKRYLKYKLIPNYSYQGDIYKKKMYGMPFCCTITMMIKKSILNTVGGFDEKVNFWQEYELALRVIQKTEVGMVAKPLAVVTRNLGDRNRLTNQFNRWVDSVKYINEKHHYIFEALGEQEKKRRAEYIYKEAAYRASIALGKKEMKGYYKKAFQISRKPEYLIRALFGISKKDSVFFEVLIMKMLYYYRSRTI